MIDYRALVGASLKEPKSAARTVLNMNVPDMALWQALSLMAILTTLLVAGLLQLVPVQDDDMGAVLESSVLFSSPFTAALLQWGQAVILVFVLHWVGRMFGGTAERRDVLAVMAWFQAVSFLLILGLVVIGMIIPLLSGLASLIFICWWIYAFICFIDVAHNFNAPWKTAGVLLAALIGFLIGTSLVLSLVGGLIFGIAGAP